MTKYAEPELVLPALDIIERNPGIATSDLILELEKALAPNGEDLEILAGRSDTKFSQKVRNLVSHHTIDQEGLGYIQSEQRGRNWYHQITPIGSVYLREHIDELPKGVLEASDLLEGLDNGLELSDQQSKDLIADGYPIDSILIRNEQRTVFEIMRRLTSGAYILDPDFQREFVWDELKQSRLIESVLMRIPLPVFYLAEREDGKIVVVDGLQRLMTFNRFLGNELTLRLPGSSPSLRDKKFSQLPTRLQQRIEDAQLIIYLIDPKVPERVRLDIFERVNSGVPLSRQQMRNSIYMGEATRWLKREANSQEFIEATGGSLNWRTMRDREVINRFCAFCLAENATTGYKGEMDSFLAAALAKMNTMQKNELESLSTKFRKSMVNNRVVFGEQAFRRHTPESKSRNVINVGLFDVFSVLMTRFSTEYVTKNSHEFSKRFYALMQDSNFIVAITLSTNSEKKVRIRFDMVQEAYRDL